MKRKLWNNLMRFGFGAFLIAVGFAVFAARMAIYPSWYKQADLGVRLSDCSSYQERVYLYCHDPERSLGFAYENFKVTQVVAVKERFVSGWKIAPEKGVSSHGTVILLHGAGADRRAMLKHASYLRGAGYTTLVIDAFNHGLSSNDKRGISFGLHESESVELVAEWAETSGLPQPIVAMGTSQGAFSSLLAASRSKHIAGVVADSSYASVEKMLLEYPAMTWIPRGVKRIALVFLTLWLNHPTSSLDVRKFAEGLKEKPVFVIHAKGDKAVLPEQAEIIDATLGEQSQLWLTEEGEHEYVWNSNRAMYEQRVLDFLAQVREKVTRP